MAWWTGKSNINVFACGNSNMFALGGGDSVPQTNNPNVFCYASETGQVPYSESNLGWNVLYNSDPVRIAEYQSYLDVTGGVGYVGQLLGNNGAPAMQIANRLQTDTGAETVHLYQCTQPGTGSIFWSVEAGWDTIERTAVAALAAIPGSPTYFDVIVSNWDGLDIIQERTPEEFYRSANLIRSKMVALGLWVPGVTQFMILESPRIPFFEELGFPGAFNGNELIKARFNDFVGIANSTGLVVTPPPLDPLPVHYIPDDNTELGNRAAAQLVAGLSRPQATVSVGGSRISVGGKKILVHGA